MDRNKFEKHLDNSTDFLFEFTEHYCFNELSKNCKYLITPSGPNPHDGLNEREVGFLKTINKYKDKLLSPEQVINILWQDNTVPLWINMDICESKPHLTIIRLLCSRRYREDKYLLYGIDKYAPFHPLLSIPPGYIPLEWNEKIVKFDVNWQKQRDDRYKPMNIRKRIRRVILRKLVILLKHLPACTIIVLVLVAI